MASVRGFSSVALAPNFAVGLPKRGENVGQPNRFAALGSGCGNGRVLARV
jgi:hypothetical protein